MEIVEEKNQKFISGYRQGKIGKNEKKEGDGGMGKKEEIAVFKIVSEGSFVEK